MIPPTTPNGAAPRFYKHLSVMLNQSTSLHWLIELNRVFGLSVLQSVVEAIYRISSNKRRTNIYHARVRPFAAANNYNFGCGLTTQTYRRAGNDKYAMVSQRNKARIRFLAKGTCICTLYWNIVKV